jgi:acetyl-CoA synthetase
MVKELFGMITNLRILIYQFPGKYFTGDGALRDEVKIYKITGRVDDVVIVSGHNLGTQTPIENAI